MGFEEIVRLNDFLHDPAIQTLDRVKIFRHGLHKVRFLQFLSDSVDLVVQMHRVLVFTSDSLDYHSLVLGMGRLEATVTSVYSFFYNLNILNFFWVVLTF